MKNSRGNSEVNLIDSIRHSILVSSIVFIPTVPLSAQESDTGSESTEPVLEEVVVVGSRIRRDSAANLDNIQELNSEALDRTGLLSAGDILRQIPRSGSPLNTQFNSSGNFGFPPDGGGVAAGETHVDLRHLGSKRVLVLVDGLRWVNGSSGSGVGNAVDLNTIPLPLIERVEILEDGASAIYGSDAIAGVVNIVTKTNQETLQTTLYRGSHDGGGESLRFSISNGWEGNNWASLAGFSYTDQAGIDALTREQSKYPKPNTGIRHGSTFTPQGRIIFSDPNTGTFINCALSEGVNNPVYDPADPCGTGDSYHPWSNGDRFNYAQFNLLLTPSTRTGAFGKVLFDVSETTTLDLKVVWNRRESTNRAAPEPLWLGAFGETGSILDTMSIHATNPYNHFGFDIGPGGTFVTRRPLESGPRVFEQTVDTFYASSQLKGVGRLFDRAVFWDGNITFSRNEANQTKHGAHNARKLKQALGPLSACTAPCVPFNFLGGYGSITDEMLGWVGFIQQDKSDQSLFNVSFNLSGEIGNVPAGPVAVATGVEFRSLEGSFAPDPVVAAGDTAGIPAQPTKGDFSVSEVYVETEIPLIERLTGAVAVRGFNYSTFGTDTTTKVSAVWDVTDSVRFRASHAQGFRAPNIGELFAGRNRFDASIADPCSDLGDVSDTRVVDNCVAQGVPADGSYSQLSSQISVLTGGNRDLIPETGTGETFSLSYHPEWLDGLSIKGTSFSYEIDDTITAYDAQTVLDSCYVEGINAFCEFIDRSTSGGIVEFRNTLFNIGTIETAGTDYSISYSNATTQIGEVSIAWNATQLRRFEEQSRNALGEVIQARRLVGRSDSDRGKPELKYYASVGLKRENWEVSWTGRFIDSMMERCSDFLDGSPDSFTALGLCSHPDSENDSDSENELEAVFYHNVRMGIRQRIGNYSLGYVVGVNNVLDEQAPVSYSASLNGYDASTHEIPDSRFIYFQLSISMGNSTD